MGELVRRFAGFSYSAQGGLQRDGRRIHLGPQARRLLEMLLDSRGTVVTKGEIAARLWPGRMASDDSIDRCAYLLRKPLRDAGGSDLIATAYGRGLSLRAPVETVDIDAAPFHRVATAPEAHVLDLWQTAYELAGNRTRDGFARAHEAIVAAAELDADSAAIWSLSADITAGRAIRGFLRPAQATAMIEEAASRALDIAPDQTPARAVLGWARGALTGRFADGLALLDRAVADDPLYGKARAYRSWLLPAVGRLDDAIADCEAGLAAAPLNQELLTLRAWLVLCAGDFDRAPRLARQGLDLRPDAATLHLVTSIADSLRGLHEPAIASARRAVDISPEDPFQLTVLAYALACAGRAKEADALIRALAEAVDVYAPPCFLAPAFLALGRRAEALEAVNRGLNEGCALYSFVSVDPRLVPLRAEISSLKRASYASASPDAG